MFSFFVVNERLLRGIARLYTLFILFLCVFIMIFLKQQGSINCAIIQAVWQRKLVRPEFSSDYAFNIT